MTAEDRTSVTLLDLGLGNLHSVLGALRRVGAEPVVGRTAADVRRAVRLVVPGQGGFAMGAAALTPDLRLALHEQLDARVPYLGICLGMQLLFEGSDEAPEAEGLGYFRGRCIALDPSRVGRVPHMGWSPATAGHSFVDDGGYYYFVHSYHCVPEDDDLIAATVQYGDKVCAAIARDRLFACQFHPEKSQDRGERLLRRFLQTPISERASSNTSIEGHDGF